MARGPLQTLTDPLTYGAVRLAGGAVNLFDIDETIPVLRGLGEVWARSPMNATRLKRAERNIAWCFPEWPRPRVERCAMDAYKRLFALAAEVAYSPSMLTDDGWPTRVELGELGCAVDQLLSRRPCLLITGHCGNWEALGSTLGVLGFPIHALYRPLDIAALDNWVRQTRARHGLDLLSKFGATEQIPRVMERGDSVGFIADQNAGPRGLFVPFFDRLASTYKSIGLLAMRFDAPVICGQAMCLGGPASMRLKYRIDVIDIIKPDDWREQPDPLFYITARYRRAIEEMVRRAPEQYLWMHRYWKSRPRHEREGRPFPEPLKEKIRALPWMTEENLGRIVERSAQDAREFAEAAEAKAS
ncbi:MAG: hypothetical protein EA376_03000 [Phycisphaeraceae bacterium]|nr:MAG: hypothetical protein EA376_03000 [Phycisphaeraceae bacterium]